MNTQKRAGEVNDRGFQLIASTGLALFQKKESTHGPFSDGFRVWVISMETTRQTQKPEDLSVDRAPEIVPNADAALSTTDLGINGVCRMLEKMHSDSTMQAIGWMHCEPEHEPP